MEQERWLRALLEACDHAINRLGEPGIEANQELLGDLHQYRGHLERRLNERGPTGRDPAHEN